MECLFCKIVRGEMQAEKIYENDFLLAFLDVNPSSKGHTLLIPKEHITNLEDVNDELLGKIFSGVKEVMKMIKRAINCDGFTIGINQGECAGARVPHLHIHIIPRFVNDGGGMVQMVVKNPPQEDLTTIAEKTRAAKEVKIEVKKEEVKKAEKKEKKKIKEEDLKMYEKILKKMKIPR